MSEPPPREPAAEAASAEAEAAEAVPPPAPSTDAPPPVHARLFPDDPPPPPPLPAHTPWVTYALIAVNVAVWGITVALGADVVSPSSQQLFDQGGNLGAITLAGEEWRLFTSMFLHAGLLHIAMNALGLYTGGKLAERLFGRLGFAAVYLISGLAGSIATALRPGVVSIGASGAIFGMLGALGAYYLIHRDRMDQRTARETRGLLVVIGFNVVFGFTEAGIDMLGHLGGLAAGFVWGFALEISGGERRMRRTLIAGGAGLAVVIAAALVAPPPFDETQQFPRAVEEVRDVEKQALSRWGELVGQAQQDKLTEAQFAEAVERDILVPWREAVGAFERSGVSCPRCPQLRAYLHARQAAFEAVRKALQDSDVAAMERGMKQLLDSAKQ